MVEVFKTNVCDDAIAKMLVDRIHRAFTDYRANFDLEDCDRILRVKSQGEIVEDARLISLLNDYGFHAEVLPDVIEEIAWRFEMTDKNEQH